MIELENSDWIIKDEQLYAKFNFNSFKIAVEFMQGIFLLAEDHQHHPKLINTYTHVEIYLCTHDLGNQVGEKDYLLAEAISKLKNQT